MKKIIPLLFITNIAFSQAEYRLYKATSFEIEDSQQSNLFYFVPAESGFGFPKMVNSNLSTNHNEERERYESTKEQTSNVFLERIGVKKYNLLFDKKKMGTIEFEMNDSKGYYNVIDPKGKTHKISLELLKPFDYVNYLSPYMIKQSLLGKKGKEWTFASIAEWDEIKIIESKSTENGFDVLLYFKLHDRFGRYEMLIDVGYGVSNTYYYLGHQTKSFTRIR